MRAILLALALAVTACGPSPFCDDAGLPSCGTFETWEGYCTERRVPVGASCGFDIHPMEGGNVLCERDGRPTVVDSVSCDTGGNVGCDLPDFEPRCICVD